MLKIIVIGPADMAKKDKLNFVSYPFIEEVRNAMKAAAI